MKKMPNEYHARRMREYRAANPQKFRDRERWSKIWTKYGVTREQWQEQFIKQDGRCAACRRKFGSDRHDRPCVDHDHKTKIFRGLLCHECNRALGFLKDSVPTLLRLVGYLLS